jgi:GntR family transcriptional regulator/MocR family aminotransferase
LGRQAKVSGVDAGLHLLLWLPQIPQRSVTNLRKHAEQLGVGVYSVAPFYPTPPPHAGLLMGYASLTEKDITEGVRRLASVVRGNVISLRRGSDRGNSRHPAESLLA